MSQRTIPRRLRRLGLIALPVAALALALAAGANAATYVYTPGVVGGTSASNGMALTTAVSAADANPSGSLSIIDLCGQCVYAPTGSLTLMGNIEITGPPTYQASSGGGVEPLVTGASITSPVNDTFQVSAGANVLFKSFVTKFGPTGFADIGNHGGTVEIDNMSVSSSSQTNIINYVPAAHTTVNNSLIANSQHDGIQVQAGTLTLNQDTIAINGSWGIDGSSTGGVIPSTATVTMNNTMLLAQNQGAAGGTDCSSPAAAGTNFTSVGSTDDDASCGINTDTGLAAEVNIIYPQNNGGPTDTLAITTALPAADESTTCTTNSDQRFFTRPVISPCDPGSYQSTATNSMQTTGPGCTVPAMVNGQPNPNETAGTMTVDATDAGIGVGPDVMALPTVLTTTEVSQTLPTATFTVASTYGFPPGSSTTPGTFTVQSSTGIQTLTYTGKTTTSFTGVTGGSGTVIAGTPVMAPGAATTDNGTVSWPTISGTWLAMTNPTAPTGGWFDAPSTAAFPVTATKPAGDVTANDTHWAFTATNWLGKSTLCR